MFRVRTISVIAALSIVFCLLLAARRPGVAADGAAILAVAALDSGNARIVMLDVTGAGLTQITEDGGGATFPTWSPDGKRMVFRSQRAGASQIYVMDADGGAISNLTGTSTSEGQPEWSHDGRRIVFTSQRTGDPEIFVMDADGSNPINLTNHPAFDSDPAWSPDGKQIAFVSNRTGRYRLWIMNADGTEQRDLMNRDLPGWTYPAWSSDGKQILFADRATDGSGQIFVAASNGTGIEQLSNGTGWNTLASWSPDNRFIAYVHFENVPTDPAGGVLTILDTNDSTRRNVAPGGLRCALSRPAWKPRSP